MTSGRDLGGYSANQRTGTVGPA